MKYSEDVGAVLVGPPNLYPKPDPYGPGPGVEGHWGTDPKVLPPDALNIVVRAGVDPAAPAAVVAYFLELDNGDGGTPAFLAAYAAANGVALP
jgi:hypothetical protein